MNFALPSTLARPSTAPTGLALPPPVAVADVRSPADRFRCVPYTCVLSAGSCVERQRLAGAARDDVAKGGKLTSERHAVRGAGGSYRACADCADGRAVARRLAS